MKIEDLRNGAIQFRAAHVEDLDTEKHEIYVRAAPYSDTFTDVGGGLMERFLPGAFARAVKAPQRIAFYHDHGGPLVGRGTEAEDKPDGVYLRAKIGRTAAAEEMLSLVADDILDSVSVEFRPVQDAMTIERRGDRMFVTHKRAILSGVAAVPEAAYSGEALILSARDMQMERDREQARLWLEAYRASSPFGDLS